MSVHAVQYEPVAPISAAQQHALVAAEQAARRFAFAPKLALLNGVSLLLAAAFSLVLSAFDAGLLLSAVLLGAAGFIELSYGKKLRAYDPVAPFYLALNQLALLALVVGYAGLKLMAAMTGQLSLADELERHPELAALLASLDNPGVVGALDGLSETFRLGVILVYSLLIGVSVLTQGGAAYYYWSRRKYLRVFLASTPSWVVDMMRRPR